MKRLILVILVWAISSLNALPVLADHHYDKCDNKIDFEKGEKLGGPFFGLGYLMSMHFLAERYCGHKLPPLKPELERIFRKHGCGPGTELFEQTMESERKLRTATLREFALEGQTNPSFTESDARKGYEVTIREFGGCDSLARMKEYTVGEPTE